MATTTNYGWDTPDDTDLVKDGASAIRTLGSSIDTTVFNNANAAIAKTIVDAKGDIIAATAADAPARLASSAVNGDVLTVDTSTATGLKWAAAASGGMTLLSTTTLSGASTNITGISGDYVNLFVIMSGQTNATADGDVRISPNGSASISTYLANWGSEGGTTSASVGSDTKIRMAQGNTIDRANTVNVLVLQIFNYANTSFNKQFTANVNYEGSTGGTYVENKGGQIATTSAITSLLFENTGGNFTAGTVLVYGVK
jgi:hypothetical protein